MKKFRRLSTLLAVMLTAMFIFTLISFADEDLSETKTSTDEEIVLDTENEPAADFGEGGETTDDAIVRIPEDTEPVETANPEDEVKDVVDTPDPSVEETGATTDSTQADQSSPNKGSYAQAGKRIREGRGFASLTDLSIPESETEPLLFYLSAIGCFSGKDEVSFIVDGGYIAACEITRPKTDTNSSKSPIATETSVSLPEADSAELTLAELKTSEAPIEAADEQPVDEPVGSFMCAVMLIAGCLKTIIQIIQYLV